MIPNTAHFVWLGRSMPWIYALGLRSAALRGGFDRVVLHCSADLRPPPGWRGLVDGTGITRRPVDVDATLGLLAPIGGHLVDRYRAAPGPAQRSDILRLAIVYREGGVYLDTDTLTVRSMAPVLRGGLFAGLERVVYPLAVRRSRGVPTRAIALTRSLLRNGLRLCPRGYRLFGAVQALYPAAANNAVFGARPRHPLLGRMLRCVAHMRTEQQSPYAFGPHLFQRSLNHDAGDDLTLHLPEVFYPLAPEIAQHWFRFDRWADPRAAVTPHTRVVHWYASGPSRQLAHRIDAAYVRANAKRQLFSALAAPLLDAHR